MNYRIFGTYGQSAKNPTSGLSVRILGDLIGASSPQCPCEIAGDLSVDEQRMYSALAELLALGLAEFALPFEQFSEYAHTDDAYLDSWESGIKRIEQAKIDGAKRVEKQLRELVAAQKDLSCEELEENWYSLFQSIGTGEIAPRYYIQVSNQGRRAYKRLGPMQESLVATA